jgi:hypothetical protein
VVSERQLLTMCYCSRRVRLIVDTSNCVVQTPDVVSNRVSFLDSHPPIFIKACMHCP